MKHPLEFLHENLIRPFFFTLLALTVILFAVLGFLGRPLNTPGGIISFEFAWTPEKAQSMLDSWNEQARIYAGFSLGIDYLFMPAYSLTLALAIRLAAGKHSEWIKSLGAAAGWGAVGAALFDAVENYALFRLLLGEIVSPYPEIAAVCAAIKFFLIAFGILFALTAKLSPK